MTEVVGGWRSRRVARREARRRRRDERAQAASARQERMRAFRMLGQVHGIIDSERLEGTFEVRSDSFSMTSAHGQVDWDGLFYWLPLRLHTQYALKWWEWPIHAMPHLFRYAPTRHGIERRRLDRMVTVEFHHPVGVRPTVVATPGLTIEYFPPANRIRLWLSLVGTPEELGRLRARLVAAGVTDATMPAGVQELLYPRPDGGDDGADATE